MKFSQVNKWVVLAVLAMLALLCAQPAFAQATAANNFDGLSGLLRQVVTQFDAGRAEVLNYAISLFWLLAGLSFFWDGMKWMFSDASAEQIFAEVAKKVLYLALYAAILGVPGHGESLAVKALNEVKNSATQLARPWARGADVHAIENPQELISTGARLAEQIGASSLKAWGAPAGKTAASEKSWFSAPWADLDIKGTAVRVVFGLLSMIVAWATAAYVLFAYVHIALQVVVLNIEFAIIGSLGLFYLAGAGSEWTTQYRDQWFRFIVSYLMKFALIVAIVTVLGGLVTDFANDIVRRILLEPMAVTPEQANDFWVNLFKGYLLMAVLVYAYRLIIEHVPATFQALMSASPSGNSSALAGRAMQDAASGAANTARGTGQVAQAGATLGQAAVNQAPKAVGGAMQLGSAVYTGAKSMASGLRPGGGDRAGKIGG
ncbi:type IV secretion system protein [Ramlibacter alkalitolerans]|uniref:Type IV secretion system protein n=1 Tax=Ramlibacter alkalitolerans TaxID=2039631 RepID=A0ABS1JU83_9BURK|nr:type IV secretion system protein [Ramlibacter alkalitolerans]MBL0427783.1 type IV secretion system protein [Ramlibacter alkalitolerans]